MLNLSEIFFAKKFAASQSPLNSQRIKKKHNFYYQKLILSWICLEVFFFFAENQQYHTYEFPIY